LTQTLSNLLERSSFPVEELEVLVGDHGSEDATAEILAAWSRRFPQLARHAVPYRAANRSVVRNHLLARARGEIVIFIDHDVLAPSGFVENHWRIHAQHPGSLVAGQTYGKGMFRREIDQFLARLELSDIAQARDVLAGSPELADMRASMTELSGPVTDLSNVLAPFRFMWTCNLSAKRADISACGNFDERYEGWGIEDDDFAQQFRVAGRRLLFSTEAWAFHVPHTSDTWQNIVYWRHNLAALFRKFPTRELECYSVFAKELAAGVRRMNGLVGLLGAVDIESCVATAERTLPRRKGRRALHFADRPGLVERLDVTDALAPAELTASASVRGETRTWPLFGLCTPFDAGELEEAIVLVDLLMLVDRHQLLMLLTEIARVAQHVFLAYGAGADVPALRSARLTFDEVVGAIRFRNLTRLYPPKLHVSQGAHA
jgi:glycosyltransferase involved in cell wall biosynthesis